MKSLWQLGILLLLPLTTHQRSNPNSSSYIGAVAEYSPVENLDDVQIMLQVNTDNYLKFIDIASQYAVDILVFPESSLAICGSNSKMTARTEAASYIPDPKDNVDVPCDDMENDYAYSIRQISCAARNHSMYIVINHCEKVDCHRKHNCPLDGLLMYNTNVVFDRSGKVIARYRKYNLFGEAGTNITSTPIPSTFVTDFGVTFGQFICFDILFETPTLNLTRHLNITDIVYSAHWFSELPFLASVEAQAAWAYANDVNLLAAGYNNPKTASGGSGIYIGQKGIAQVIYEDKASNFLIISEIPKVINGKRALNINANNSHRYTFTKFEITTSESFGTGTYTHLLDDLMPYTTELIDVTKTSYNKILCDRELCCEFKLKLHFDQSLFVHNAKYYRYRLVAFNGVRTFGGVSNGGVKICGIISCTSDTLKSCGIIIDSNEMIVKPTVFNSIDISMRSVDNISNFFMPMSLSTNMLPLNVTDFSFNQFIDTKKGLSTYNMSLVKAREDLLTFAIFGRNFIVDGSDITKPSSSAKILTSPLLLFTVILLYLMPYVNKF